MLVYFLCSTECVCLRYNGIKNSGGISQCNVLPGIAGTAGILGYHDRWVSGTLGYCMYGTLEYWDVGH